MALTEQRLAPPTGHPADTEAGAAAASQQWGNSAPLALAAFALTTFLLSMVNAGFVAKGVEPVVFAVAFTFGGTTQLIAGIIQLRAGKTFGGGVLFSSFGAFWLSFWALAQFFLKDVPKAEVGHAVGLYLIAWGIFSAWMWLASFRTNIAASPGAVKVGGYLGLVVAGCAAYLSAAEVCEASYGREILPVGPLGKD